jgi:hypothetical protein
MGRAGQQHRVVAGARGIDVVEQVNVRIAPEDDARATPLNQFLDVTAPPPGAYPSDSGSPCSNREPRQTPCSLVCDRRHREARILRRRLRVPARRVPGD